ncbi:MAG: DUF2292 domain-containing protein [Limisphaerales bacterium]
METSAIQIKADGGVGETLDRAEVVRRQVGSLHYGAVQIAVRDLHISQLEKTGRVRLDKAPAQTKTVWAGRKAGA